MFLDVLLITNERCNDEIREYLKPGILPQLPDLNVEVISLDSKIDEDIDQWGTADVLRYICADYIKPNVDFLRFFFTVKF